MRQRAGSIATMTEQKKEESYEKKLPMIEAMEYVDFSE
jgi:hypothetical protein